MVHVVYPIYVFVLSKLLVTGHLGLIDVELLEVDDCVHVEHGQTLGRSQLMLRHQHVYTVLVALAVVGADARDRVDGVEPVLTLWALASLRPFPPLLLDVLLLPALGLEVDGEEVLVLVVIFDPTIHYCFVVGVLFS